jgi:hypothetical protein
VVKTGLASISLLAAFALAAPALGQEATGSIGGKIKDQTGAGVPGVRGEVAGPEVKRTFRTDDRGAFAVGGLRPGTYVVTLRKQGFQVYVRGAIVLRSGSVTPLELALVLAPIEEKVTVQEEQAVITLSPETGAGAIVLKGADLDALPDDPDELAEALQALAGPAAGPNGGQIYIDGFTGGAMPSKAAIREIRINASPFSAEYDRPGHGRIEILTRPGSDQWRGQASFRFDNQALNTKDPYATNEPDYRRMVFGAELSGPVPGKKASFAIEADRRLVDDTSLVSGTSLDGNLELTALQRSIVTPQWRTEVNPRLDVQLGQSHTLTLRYEYESRQRDSMGVGGFSLESRAYDMSQVEHDLQMAETSTFGKAINELRFRWSREAQHDDPLGTGPALVVQDAFSAGGASVGLSSNVDRRTELQNITSWASGGHSVRAGLRWRTVRLDDTSRRGFNGSVSFAGDFGPVLDQSGQPVLGPDGQPLVELLTSLERYRRTLSLARQAVSPDVIRSLGGGPTRLDISGGDPLAVVSQWDLGAFVQDDWKVHPDVLLGVGLRYEVQDNIHDRWDLSPRLTAAWSPGSKGDKAPKTVLRGAFGIFYDRVGESLTLDSQRYDGSHQQSFQVTDPVVLDQLSFADDQVSGIPSIDGLLAYALPQTVRVVAPDIKTPRTTQWSVSVERALPANTSLVLNYLGTRTSRVLRSRVVGIAGAGISGFPEADTVYRYESTGRYRQDQIMLGLNSRFGSRASFFVRYTLGWARSDSDGAGTFPMDSSEPGLDWGRASNDVRHRFTLGGRLDGPLGIRLSPFIIVSSGRPFNITTGRDDNGDSVFNDRPAHATDPSSPDAVSTPWGVFNLRPDPSQASIARNLGEGPGFFVVNLRISRTFRMARTRAPVTPQGDAPPPDLGDGRRVGGPGGGAWRRSRSRRTRRQGRRRPRPDLLGLDLEPVRPRQPLDPGRQSQLSELR